MPDCSHRPPTTVLQPLPPRRFNEFVQIHTGGRTDLPSATLSLHGHIGGEISVTPRPLNRMKEPSGGITGSLAPKPWKAAVNRRSAGSD